MLPAPSRLLRAALVVALLLLPGASASAQEVVRESRSVASFTEIEFSIPGTLHLRQGGEQSVDLEAPERVLSKIETTVSGEALEISSDGDSGLFENLFGGGDDLDTDQIDVYVTVSSLSRLTLAGSGTVIGDTPIDGTTLALSVAGSGAMDLDLTVDELSVQIAGSGDATLRGEVPVLDVNIAGSGDLEAAGLRAERVEVRIAGSGDAEVSASDHLTAEIFGSGDVAYRGRPTIETTTMGSGAVTALDK